MKKSMKSKMLAAAMTLAMVFTMIPIMGAPVYADDPAPPAPGIALGSDVLSVGSNTSGAATVHMAGTKWRVIGYGVSQEGGIPQVASSADTMTLIAADNLKTVVKFRADGQTAGAHNYGQNTNNEDSNLKTEIEKLTGTGTEKIFSNEEKAGIVPRDLEPEGYTRTWPYTNGIAGDKVEGALLWPLSTQEATYMNDNLREVNAYWWLRSPGTLNDTVAHVYGGSVDSHGSIVYCTYGVRPAFNFNLESVIFTSAAVGGKSSGDVGAGSLKSVEPNTNNEWKLTLKSGHDNFKVDNVSTCDGKTVNIKYSGAVAKKGEYISAIITDKNDAVKYYGNLIEFADEDSAQGIAKVTIEDKMEPTDKLYIFNEQLNGEKNTDYSSALNRIDVPEPEEHNYLWEYVNDGEHKRVCDKCGDEITEEHTYNQGRCTVCNGACGHSSLNDSYSHNLDRHWKTCAYCGNVIEHEEHAWQDEWTADGTEHWHECEVCQRKKDEEEHKWDEGTVTKEATCEENGVKSHTCTICNGTKDEEIPTTGHEYGEWTELDANQHQRVCEHDATHIEKENHSWDEGKVTTPPTTEKDGVRTLTCTVCGAEKTESIDKLPAYEAKDSTGNAIQTLSWQKGSGKSLDLTIECDIDDSQTYGKFTGLEIDGEPVADSDYTAAAGSLKLSIKPSYLETLSVGDHSMKAKFSDGSTELTLRVLAAADKKNDKGKPGKVSPKSGTKTGDDSNPLLWYTLLFSSLMVLLGGVVIQRRYARSRRG